MKLIIVTNSVSRQIKTHYAHFVTKVIEAKAG